MKGYPSWRYHRTLEPKIVHNPDEDHALGPEWADTPAAFEKPAEPEHKPEPIVEPHHDEKHKRHRSKKAGSA